MLFGRRKRHAPTWTPIGRILHVRPRETGVALTCENGHVDLTWVSLSCLRLRFQPQSEPDLPPDSHHASQSAVSPAFEMVEGPQALELRTSMLLCRVGKHPFRLDLENLDNRILCMDRGGCSSVPVAVCACQ